MTKKLHRTMALLLCLALALAGCTLPWGEAAGSTNPLSTENVVSFQDMEYTRPDGEAVVAQLKELTQKISEAESFEEMLAYDEESGEIIGEFSTMASLAYIYNSLDISDSYYEEEYRYCSDWSVTIGVVNNDLNRAIVEGPYAEEYRAHHGDYVYESILNSLLLSSPETEALQQSREQLTTDYYKMLDEEMYLEWEGEQYTIDELPGLAESYEEYSLLLGELYAQAAEQYTEIYREMIALDKEIASILGFDSAAEMYYLSFSRDFTPEDSLALCASVKEYISPLVVYALYSGYAQGSYSFNDAVGTMPTALANIDPQLAQVWQIMVDYGLYDYAYATNKRPGAYTTMLYSYSEPFCFGNWSDSFSDISTLTHEFGHFYGFWMHREEDVVQSLDVAEIYSQALELLMHAQFELFTEDEADVARAENLASMVDAITYQSLLEEFQLTVYEMDDFTTQDLGELYTRLLEEYGYGDLISRAEDGYNYGWFGIHHLFETPFYTISYATSAYAALQIYLESVEDYAAGVQTYLDMVASDQNRPFQEILADAGLDTPFSETGLQELAGVLQGVFVG